MTRPLDAEAHDLGSILTVAPCSDLAEAWIERHLGDASRYGGAVAIEHRYGPDILAAMLAAGLYVTLDGREPLEENA